MAIDTIKTSAILDGSVTSADLDTNIDIAGTLDVTGATTLDGNLKVGTTTNAWSGNNTVVIKEDSGDGGITLVSSSTSNNMNIGFADTETSSFSDQRGLITYLHASDDMRFMTANSEKIRILSSGGITFNGDTAAANALDDYEEGTFTATVHDALSGGNAASYSTANGYYTKIGNLVFAHFDAIDINTTGLTNQAVLCFNLPFTPGTTTTLSHNWNFNEVDLGASDARNYVFQCISGQTRGRFIYSRDNTTAEYLRENMIEDGIADIKVSFTYWAA